MGQQISNKPKHQSKLFTFNSTNSQIQHQILQELSTGIIIMNKQKNQLKFIRQLSFTSQQDYQNTYIKYLQKMSERNQHLLKLEDVKIRAQNTFCSTFYKIALVYQYNEHNLKQEIESRVQQNRKFDERQIWSILCSCIVAMSYLEKHERIHSSLKVSDIQLDKEGIVKIYPLGMVQYNFQQQSATKVLCYSILNCLMFEEYPFIQSTHLLDIVGKKQLNCSEEMKDILTMMLQPSISFSKLQQELFKLVQDDSIISLSFGQSQTLQLTKKEKNNYLNQQLNSKNSIKTQPNHNQKKTIQKEDLNNKQHKKNSIKSSLYHNFNQQIAKQLPKDTPDQPSIYVADSIQENENPDETEENETQDQSQKSSITHNSNLQTSNEVSKSTREIVGFHQSHQMLKSSKASHHQISENVKSNHNHDNTHLSSLFQGIYNEQLINMKKPPSLQPSKLNKHIQQEKDKIALKSSRKVKEQINSSIFTDPNLLNQIKSDLEKYQMKKQEHLKQPKHESLKGSRSVNQNINKKKETEKHQNTHENINIKYQSKTNQNNIGRPNILQQISNVITHGNQTQVQNCQLNYTDNIINDMSIGFKKKQKVTQIINNPTKNEIEEKIQNKIISKEQKKNGIQSQIQTKQNNSQSSKNQTLKANEFTSNTGITQSRQRFQKIALTNCLSHNNSQKFINNSNLKKNEMQYSRQSYARGKYQGTKLNDMRHGNGTFYYSEGGKYVGQWFENRMHGFGTLYYPNQQIAYQGEWKYDQLYGKGVLYNQQISELKGSFDYRDWSNVEEYWVKYIGQFKEDNKCGKGKLFLVNGEYFEGQFSEDEIHGQGLFVKKDGSRIQGYWKNNKLIKIL